MEYWQYFPSISIMDGKALMENIDGTFSILMEFFPWKLMEIFILMEKNPSNFLWSFPRIHFAWKKDQRKFDEVFHQTDGNFDGNNTFSMEKIPSAWKIGPLDFGLLYGMEFGLFLPCGPWMLGWHHILNGILKKFINNTEYFIYFMKAIFLQVLYFQF